MYSDRGVYGNGAKELFSRMRRGEIGHHRHVAGPYLIRYAQGASWREDHRRVDNGRRGRNGPLVRREPHTICFRSAKMIFQSVIQTPKTKCR